MLNERIRTRMEQLKLSQADVVRKSGLSSGYVSDLLAGNRGKRVSASTIVKLAGALKVQPSFFMRRDSHMRPARKASSAR